MYKSQPTLIPNLFEPTVVNNKLQSIPFKNVVDVASNGQRFRLTNAANLKTYIPSKINTQKNHKGTYGSGILITKL
jgi:hypothetical protein